jgi:penicillin amidase
VAKIFKWLMRGFITILVLGIIAVSLSYYFASRSLPDYNASINVDGVNGPIEIVRDSSNVPHIFAKDDNDIYFGLGYAHAQDRLWQMTMLRRTAQGRLSEVFGETTLSIDDFIRRLDLYRLSSMSLMAQSPEVKAALESYSNGVNSRLRQIQTEALGRGAPEFFLFPPEIDAWAPTDSIAIIKVMALQLSDHLKREVTRAQVSLAIGSDMTKDILPDAPGVGRMDLPEFATLFPNFKPKEFSAPDTRLAYDPVSALGMAGASNAWAANGERTASGKPLLANDPHLGLSAPSIWMLARLGFEDNSVIGGTIPGIPTILVGRNEKFAWGLTTANLDDVDVHIEKLNPENSNQYLTSEGYKNFEQRDVLITIKDQPTKTVSLRWTQNGPVIPPNHYQLGSITPPGHVTSINWTALSDEDTSMTASVGIMRASSITQARLAAERYVAPSQNLTMADGNSVAMLMVGQQPSRDPKHISQGRIPSQGWLEENRWNGIHDFETNPYTLDPKSGVVATTNNKITDKAFPFHVSHSWGDTQRIERLNKLLNNREVHTRDSFIEAQLDTFSFTAQSLLALIGQELWFTGDRAPTGTPEHRRETALTMLAAWNGEMSEHLPEPLIYAAWMRTLQQRIITDELGPLSEKFSRPAPVFLERVYRDIEGAGKWCDIKQSTVIETCVDIARQSLDATLIELTEKYGDRIDSWRWGEAHQAHHDHEVLGKVNFIKWVTNIRQDTSGGDNTIMRGRTEGSGKTPFANIHAAGYRAVVDFADPDSSLYVISTGQSGHFLSRHYDDMAQLWRRGEYIPMSLDTELARAGAIGITTITPTVSE